VSQCNGKTPAGDRCTRMGRVRIRKWGYCIPCSKIVRRKLEAESEDDDHDGIRLALELERARRVPAPMPWQRTG
jgi:hypothetical protein